MPSNVVIRTQLHHARGQERAFLTIFLKELAKRHRIEHLLGQDSFPFSSYNSLSPFAFGPSMPPNYHHDLPSMKPLLSSSVRPSAGGTLTPRNYQRQITTCRVCTAVNYQG